MKLEDLKAILEETNYPVAYSHFKSKQKMPYICYLVAYSSNFFADNKVHQEIDNIQIELYTDKKDLQAEKKVKDLLNENNIPYETSEIFIEDENCYQKIYEVRF